VFKRFAPWLEKHTRMLKIGLIAFIACLGISGMLLQVKYWLEQSHRTSNKLVEYVKEHATAHDVYLIPVDDEEFERFRLSTGAPVFITWKSHPYKDIEVLEWYKRYKLGHMFYSDSTPLACLDLEAITSGYHITRIVIDKTRGPLNCSGLSVVYEDKYYILYGIKERQL
jgi:hypothetical protein